MCDDEIDLVAVTGFDFELQVLEVGEFAEDGVETGDALALWPCPMAAMYGVESGEAMLIMVTDTTMAIGATLEVRIMGDDENAVAGDLDVELDAQDAATA